MSSAALFRLGAVCGLAAIIIGALGAHGLSARISAAEIRRFDLANFYHLIHAVALLCIGAMPVRDKTTRLTVRMAGWCLFAGLCLFSGSLYGIVFWDLRWPGRVAPVGGVLLMLGWAILIIAGLNWRKDQTPTG